MKSLAKAIYFLPVLRYNLPPMKCPSCDHEIPANAAACPSCATSLSDSFSPTRLLDPKRPVKKTASDSSGKAGSFSSFEAIDDARFVPGEVLAERYRIVGLLGRGGMGEVIDRWRCPRSLSSRSPRGPTGLAQKRLPRLRHWRSRRAPFPLNVIHQRRISSPISGSSFPMTTELSTWYATDFLMALTIGVALVIFGFYTSLAGQPLFGGRLLQD